MFMTFGAKQQDDVKSNRDFVFASMKSKYKEQNSERISEALIT